ncbi:MAG: hypothetical protein FJ100_07080 [Deltaproteobacteria bacterium]|nr:hypothetical protein [Deltaproteobacteria bacterium]
MPPIAPARPPWRRLLACALAWACAACSDGAVTAGAEATALDPADGAVGSELAADSGHAVDVETAGELGPGGDPGPEATAGGDAAADAGTGFDLAQAQQQCESASDCPAALACHVAACTPKGQCAYAALADGATCSDGNACTTGDTCAGGSCAGPGQLDCDDANPCTGDKCNPLAGCVNLAATASTACDDGDACTQGDACEAGTCSPGVNTCQCKQNTDCGKYEDGDLCNGTLYCDKAAGPPYVCKPNPASVVVCPSTADGPCQKNACVPATGQCQLQTAPANTPCDDGDKCTTGDFCEVGQCKPGANTCFCKSDADCKGQEDGNACNGTLFCNKAAAACQVNPVTVVSCLTIDDTACSKNTCNPKTGLCVHLPVAEGKPCDDGNACTPNETCQAGTCQSAANVCECAKDADCAAKDDGNPCNGSQFCDVKAGKCVTNPATVVHCNTDDDPACLRDVCDPKSGECAATALPKNGTPCDDGNPCTVAEACAGGACVATVNTCQCQSDADCKAKEDGDLCNGTLFCDKAAGKCVVNPATVVVCPNAFDEVCLANTCDKLTGTCGMKPVNQGNQCPGDNACSAGGWCQFGVCEVGETSTCACIKDADCGKFEDGDLCNGTLYCDKTGQAPVCKVIPGTVKTCATTQDTACLVNQCVATIGNCAMTAKTGKCDDGDACTVGDTCQSGACAKGVALTCNDGDACTMDLCKAGYGCLSLPQAQTACDDGNPCTADGCAAQLGCTHPPVSGPCDDGSPCTANDACKDGACNGAKAACDDGNPCTDDLCNAKSGCAATPNSAGCDDGNVCTKGDACKDGKCTAGAAAVVCDDNNPCTDDTCQAKTGCLAVPNIAPCDDGNACTTFDACKNGACTGGSANCDDANPCTDDACAAGKCTYTANAAECSDGNACSSGDKCTAGKCAGAGKVACDDGKVCTDDACDAKIGCVATAKSGACDDGDACTAQDGCAGGYCAGQKKVCDDGNACTDDGCDAKAGCGAKPNSAACSDGNQCTSGDACANGTCKAGAASNCDDGDLCTQDGCNASNGICTHADNGASKCNDNNPCSDDVCHKTLGCANPSNTKPCDDGNPCTVGEACKGGGCQGGTALPCDDKQACTNDSCDPKKGCVYANNTAACDDGVGCTTADICAAGKCAGVIQCDDKNVCTADTCDFSTGNCKYAGVSTGNCDDANVCTEGDYCQAGQCIAAKLKDCADGNVCTQDECDKVKGCYGIATPESPPGTKVPCDTGTCTALDNCEGTTCKASGKPRLWDKVYTPPAGTQTVYTTSVATTADAIYATGHNGALMNDEVNYAGIGLLFKFSLAGDLVGTVDLWSTAAIGDARTVLVDQDGSLWVIGNNQAGGKIAHFDADLKLLSLKNLGVILCNFATGSTVATVHAATWVSKAGGKPRIGVTGHGEAANQSSHTAFATTIGTDFVYDSCWLYAKNANLWKSSGRAIAQRPDGLVVIGGFSSEPGGGGNTDAWLALYDPAKPDATVATWKTGTAYADSVRAVAVGSDNSIYAAGYMGVPQTGKDSRNAWFARLDPKLKPWWETADGGGANDSGEALVLRPDGHFYAAGYRTDGASNEGPCLWTMSNDGAIRDTDKTSTTATDGFRALTTASNGDLVAWGFRDTLNPFTPRTRLVRASPWVHLSCTSAAKCQALKWQDCDDGKPCTYDECNSAAAGCAHFADSKLYCNDGDACTYKDTCNASQVCAGAVIACTDNNPCTADSCDKAKGCQNDNLPDNTPCGAGKQCKAGVCL